MSTVAEVRKQIKSGKTAPLYLLEGDDLQSRHDLGLEFASLVDEGLQRSAEAITVAVARRWHARRSNERGSDW